MGIDSRTPRFSSGFGISFVSQTDADASLESQCVYIYIVYIVYIYISNVYIYIYMCVLFHVYYQFLSTTCSFLGGDGEHVDHDP